jgi:hypothetical protein
MFRARTPAGKVAGLPEKIIDRFIDGVAKR